MFLHPVHLLFWVITGGASGYSGLLGNLSVYVCVSLDRQNPLIVFKTLQYQNMWASYDMLEKNIIRSFAEKLLSREKACKSFRLYMLAATYTGHRLAIA